MENKPMAGWRVVMGFWGFSALVCLPMMQAGAVTAVGFLFLGLLITTSVYLYSKRFSGFVNGLLDRLNLIA